jgi:hypothetical protein
MPPTSTHVFHPVDLTGPESLGKKRNFPPCFPGGKQAVWLDYQTGYGVFVKNLVVRPAGIEPAAPRLGGATLTR